MIADSSKANIRHKKHGEESYHSKTENKLYQNQSLRVYHKFSEETNPFAIEKCKSKKRASVSVMLALFNCSTG